MSFPPTSGPTSVTNTYAVLPMKATSIAPPIGATLVGNPLANVVVSPVLGSTRRMLPVTASVTYSAPPGPTVLPEVPWSPATSSVAWGASHAGCALAPVGSSIVISAAADNSNFRSERIQTPFSIVFATLANELKPVRDVACAGTTDQGKQNDLDEHVSTCRSSTRNPRSAVPVTCCTIWRGTPTGSRSPATEPLKIES